jgi:hypothetical protein
MEVQTKVVLFYKQYPHEAFLACYLSKSVSLGNSRGTQEGNFPFSFNQTSNRVTAYLRAKEDENH